MRMRMEDEKRLELARQRKEETKRYLASQMQEKKERERQDKALNDQQAVMWKKDKEIYETEEQRLQDKIKGINNQNADFLNKQMADKKMRASSFGMNKHENKYNKDILKMINQKRREG